TAHWHVRERSSPGSPWPVHDRSTTVLDRHDHAHRNRKPNLLPALRPAVAGTTGAGCAGSAPGPSGNPGRAPAPLRPLLTADVPHHRRVLRAAPVAREVPGAR